MKVTEPLKAIQIYAPGGPEQRFKKEKMSLDFEETESEKILRQTVREFARKEIAPHARKWDEEERFPSALIPKLAELGLMGMRVPEELRRRRHVDAGHRHRHRGAGARRRLGGAHRRVAQRRSCTGHILLAGNDAQKKKYLPDSRRAKWLGAWGLTEPSLGLATPPAPRRARSSRATAGSLNGTKTFITQGSVGARLRDHRRRRRRRRSSTG